MFVRSRPVNEREIELGAHLGSHARCLTATGSADSEAVGMVMREREGLADSCEDYKRGKHIRLQAGGTSAWRSRGRSRCGSRRSPTRTTTPSTASPARALRRKLFMRVSMELRPDAPQQ